MLRHLTNAWKVIITAMKDLQYRYISGSGTYIKLTVVESFASECGKIWSIPLRRDFSTSLRGKTGENHLTHILVWHFLKLYISLQTLGNELQFKRPQEKMSQLTLWSSNRTKNFIALGTPLLSRRHEKNSPTPPLLSSLGPADKHWHLGSMSWSLMSTTGHCYH